MIDFFYATFNSQAPDQKSNPQAPDRTYTSISVKTLSQTLEIFTNVFAGAEKHNLTLNYEIWRVAVESFTDYLDTNIDDFHQKLRPLADSPIFALKPLNLLSYAPTWPYAPNITTKRQHFLSSFRWHIQNFFGSGPQKHFLRNQPMIYESRRALY